MPKKRAVQKKKAQPGGPSTAGAGVHTLTAAEIKRLVGTQVRQSNSRFKQQLPATIRETIQTTISSVIQNGWLGPQQPVAPIGIPPDEPDVRMWEYTPGYNVNWQPRKYQPYSFPQLIWISQNFDLLAEVIERRKDEVMTSQWELLDDEGVVPDEEQNAVTRALEYPDRIHPFSTWVRMLLHGMYTIDAACVYIHRSMDGGVYSLDLPDGSTITPLVGQDGKPPQPPDPAYLQVIYGTPYSLLTQPSGDLLVEDDQGQKLDATPLASNELLYCPRNPRPQSPLYGWSQVEQALMTIAIGIKLEQSALYYHTAGNIPESLIGVPDTWTPKQIASFQSYFDAMLRGNIKRRSGSAIFVPGGMKAAMMKEYGFSREQWEWLARVVCATFHVAVSPYVQQVNRATAESAAVMQMQEGLQPDLTWLTDVMNLVMRVGFRTKLRFAYKDDDKFDPDKKAAADKTDIQGGVRTIAEVREERGYDPYPSGVGDKPFVVTASGITLVQDIEGQSAAATQTAQSKAELAANPPPPPVLPGTQPPGQANGKPPAPQQAKPAPQSANGNGKGPAANAKDQAEKLLDYGGARRIIRKGAQRFMDVGDFLVPLNDDEGRPLL